MKSPAPESMSKSEKVLPMLFLFQIELVAASAFFFGREALAVLQVSRILSLSLFSGAASIVFTIATIFLPRAFVNVTYLSGWLLPIALSAGNRLLQYENEGSTFLLACYMYTAVAAAFLMSWKELSLARYINVTAFKLLWQHSSIVKSCFAAFLGLQAYTTMLSIASLGIYHWATAHETLRKPQHTLTLNTTLLDLFEENNGNGVGGGFFNEELYPSLVVGLFCAASLYCTLQVAKNFTKVSIASVSKQWWAQGTSSDIGLQRVNSIFQESLSISIFGASKKKNGTSTQGNQILNRSELSLLPQKLPLLLPCKFFTACVCATSALFARNLDHEGSGQLVMIGLIMGFISAQTTSAARGRMCQFS